MFGLNPKKMEKMMKQLGVKQKSIEVEEVIIKCKDKDLIIKNPTVNKINMMGQETLQIAGDIQEVSNINEDDVNTVVEQTGVDENKAKEALERNNGDLAKTILELKG